MIRLHAPTLPPHAVDFLKAQQDAIDALSDYASRVRDGKARWRNKSNTNEGELALHAIREGLSVMSRGRRCHYCEDSCADEVEHFQPKDLYPRPPLSGRTTSTPAAPATARRASIGRSWTPAARSSTSRALTKPKPQWCHPRRVRARSSTLAVKIR
jgi:hypothetical protein